MSGITQPSFNLIIEMFDGIPEQVSCWKEREKRHVLATCWVEIQAQTFPRKHRGLEGGLTRTNNLFRRELGLVNAQNAPGTPLFSSWFFFFLPTLEI